METERQCVDDSQVKRIKACVGGRGGYRGAIGTDGDVAVDAAFQIIEVPREVKRDLRRSAQPRLRRR